MNYFELLKVPQKFEIDEVELENAWREATSKVHPDRFATASASEKKVALSWASLINEAYSKLKNDATRGFYLCELNDINLNTPVSGGFLATQMLWHEQLEEYSNDKPKLRTLANVINEKKSDLIACITELIDHKADYEKAFSKLQQLQYIQKILSLIESRL